MGRDLVEVRSIALFWLADWTTTLQETNISPKNGILKMSFRTSQGGDMLIPWRVSGKLQMFVYCLFSPRKFGEDEPILDGYLFQMGWFNHQLGPRFQMCFFEYIWQV